ncbi:MAG: hypothetical protein GY941_08950 [Planctomycetes bacterium]|nr:hypothetical protein [Planctomycetota bacterium]
MSGSLNAPIASAILGFGISGLDYAVLATISSIVSFQIERSSSLYDDKYANLPMRTFINQRVFFAKEE